MRRNIIQCVKEKKMDFRSFKNQADQREKTQGSFDQNDARKTAESYKNKSDSELLSDIFKVANEQKANGSLSDEKLRAFADSVAPMLNEEQKQRLNGVIEMLKGNRLKP